VDLKAIRVGIAQPIPDRKSTTARLRWQTIAEAVCSANVLAVEAECSHGCSGTTKDTNTRCFMKAYPQPKSMVGCWATVSFSWSRFTILDRVAFLSSREIQYEWIAYQPRDQLYASVDDLESPMIQIFKLHAEDCFR